MVRYGAEWVESLSDPEPRGRFVVKFRPKQWIEELQSISFGGQLVTTYAGRMRALSLIYLDIQHAEPGPVRDTPPTTKQYGCNGSDSVRVSYLSVGTAVTTVDTAVGKGKCLSWGDKCLGDVLRTKRLLVVRSAESATLHHG